MSVPRADASAMVSVTVTTDTVIDGTVADTGTVKKRNFHTGLDPVSRENNCAQRTLSTAVTAATTPSAAVPSATAPSVLYSTSVGDPSLTGDGDTVTTDTRTPMKLKKSPNTKLRIAVLAMLLPLAGCVSTQDKINAVALGMDKQQVIQAMGAPTTPAPPKALNT